MMPSPDARCCRSAVGSENRHLIPFRIDECSDEHWSGAVEGRFCSGEVSAWWMWSKMVVRCVHCLPRPLFCALLGMFYEVKYQRSSHTVDIWPSVLVGKFDLCHQLDRVSVYSIAHFLSSVNIWEEQIRWLYRLSGTLLKF